MMAYCPECGSRVDSQANFCSECGSPVQEEDEGSIGPVESEASRSDVNSTEVLDSPSAGGGTDWKKLGVAGVFGLFIGFLLAWATLNLWELSPFAFVGGWLVSGYHISKRDSLSEAIGSGLYIMSLAILSVPLLFYGPVVFRGSESLGAFGFLGNLLAIVIWGFVFLLFALLTAGLGRLFKRRASK